MPKNAHTIPVYSADFWNDVGANGRVLAQSASNAVASTVTGPVDLISWALRKVGVPIADAPVGGSQWATAAGITPAVQQSPASLTGELIGNLLPTLAPAKAAELASTITKLGANLATPGMLNKQAGVILSAGDAGKSISSIKSAQKLIDAGDDLTAWQRYGIFKSPADDVLRAVVPDTGATILTNKLDRTGTTLGGMPVGPTQWVDVPRSGTLRDIMTHPELEAKLPGILDAPLRRDPMPGGGAYYPKSGAIGVGSTRSERDTLNILLHELQHAIQARSGLPAGGNPGMFFADADKFNAASGVLTKLEARGRDLKEPSNAVSKLQDLFLQARKQADAHYLNLAGELEARTVEKQFMLGDYTTLPTKLVTPTAAPILPEGQLPVVDTAPELQVLIEQLLQQK